MPRLDDDNQKGAMDNIYTSWSLTITPHQSWNGNSVTEKALLVKCKAVLQSALSHGFKWTNLPDKLLADLASWKASEEESTWQRGK